MTAKDGKRTVTQPLSQAFTLLTLHFLKWVQMLALATHLPCRHENNMYRHDSPRPFANHSAAGITECAVQLCCHLEQPRVGSASVVVL